MTRYRVTTTFVRTEEVVQYLDAEDVAGAEELAEETLENSFLEGEQVDCEVSTATEELDPDAPHEIEHGSSMDPERWNEQICKVCDRKLVWTGQDATDPRNTTGATIPGPWVHENDWGANDG